MYPTWMTAGLITNVTEQISGTINIVFDPLVIPYNPWEPYCRQWVSPVAVVGVIVVVQEHWHTASVP